MALIAKRKVQETWRQAITARGGPDTGPRCLAAFDGLVAAGRGEAEAAFRAMAEFGLLWEVPIPTDPARSEGAPGPDAAVDKHTVPSV